MTREVEVSDKKEYEKSGKQFRSKYNTYPLKEGIWNICDRGWVGNPMQLSARDCGQLWVTSWLVDNRYFPQGTVEH